MNFAIGCATSNREFAGLDSIVRASASAHFKKTAQSEAGFETESLLRT